MLKFLVFMVPTIAIYMSADTDPYRGFQTVNPDGSMGGPCCFSMDCAPLPDSDVKIVPGGYIVKGWGWVPNAKAQPGFDLHFHLCEYPKSVLRCFMTPLFGT